MRGLTEMERYVLRGPHHLGREMTPEEWEATQALLRDGRAAPGALCDCGGVVGRHFEATAAGRVALELDAIARRAA